MHCHRLLLGIVKTTSDSWFSLSTWGFGTRTQVIRFVQQTPLLAEPSYQLASYFKMQVFGFHQFWLVSSAHAFFFSPTVSAGIYRAHCQCQTCQSKCHLDWSVYPFPNKSFLNFILFFSGLVKANKTKKLL